MNEFYSTNDLRYMMDIPASIIVRYGEGKIGLINFNLCQNYYDGSHFVLRDFLSEMINSLHNNPIVRIEGSHLVHVIVNKLDDRLIISLINTAGNHSNPGILGFDEIPAIGPLKITVRYHKKPSSVKLQPVNIKPDYKYKNEMLVLEVPELDIFSIIEIK